MKGMNDKKEGRKREWKKIIEETRNDALSYFGS